MLVSLLFLKVLEGLGRSRRLKGIVSTNFRQKRSVGFQAMTKKTKKYDKKSNDYFNVSVNECLLALKCIQADFHARSVRPM